MHTCLFLTFRSEATSLAAPEMAKLEAMLRAAPKLRKALLHMPDAASDPYVKDDTPPLLVLQLYYDRSGRSRSRAVAQRAASRV